MLSACSRWRLRHSFFMTFLSILGVVTFVGGVILWYGVNSDSDYFHPILTQLIPAGHCACQTSTTFQCTTCFSCSHESWLSTPSPIPSPTWEFEYRRDGNNAGLDRDQCNAAFPGLFEDVERAKTYWKKQGGISTAELDIMPLKAGMGRLRISRGELYVISVRAGGEDHRRKIVAVLGAIHRALVADPERNTRPDLEFVFSVEDKVEDVTNAENPVWVLARTGDEEAVWLMPDFGFWAWDNLFNSIGPYDQVVEKAAEYDSIPWEDKHRQLVWRGKPSFAPKLRRALMDATRDQPWADVQPVDWHRQSNIIAMEDHCKYMFIAHVEGRSYSASLKYRQACRSVIVAHQLQYIQHHHYLLVSEGPHQNYVEVARDFSDLADQLEPLLADPAAAEHIAENSVRTFRERYLTPAAEACYWRSLWDGYGSVWNQTYVESGAKRRGLRYESFILQSSDQMFDFNH